MPENKETSEEYVARVTQELRFVFQQITDPAERLHVAQQLGRVLNVPASQAFVYLAKAAEVQPPMPIITEEPS